MIINISIPNKPKGYPSNPNEIDRYLPSHLQGSTKYRVVDSEWVSDGRYYMANYYETPKAIPTGTLKLKLEFVNDN